MLGYEGFSGNESILYHLQSPCRLKEVGEFTPIVREEWMPDAHVHRADRHAARRARRRPDRAGRRLLKFNADIEVSICKPDEDHEGFYRNGEGDEVVFVHRGRGRRCERSSAAVPTRRSDYVVIPRGTTYRWGLEGGEQVWLCFHTPGEIETPNRYRNRYGQLLEHAPFCQRDFHPPAELETIASRGEYEVTVRVRDGYQRYVLDYHPFDVVGWDGYVYPYTFNIARLRAADRAPAPAAARAPDLPGPELRDLLVLPADARLGPARRSPLPYHHSNLQSEEVIYYVDGDYAARKGVDVGCDHAASLRPAARPAARRGREARWASTRTDELAVMWDTFRPLKLTTLRSARRPGLRLLVVRGEGRVLRGAAGQHLGSVGRYSFRAPFRPLSGAQVTSTAASEAVRTALWASQNETRYY